MYSKDLLSDTKVTILNALFEGRKKAENEIDKWEKYLNTAREETDRYKETRIKLAEEEIEKADCEMGKMRDLYDRFSKLTDEDMTEIMDILNRMH